MHPVLWTIPGLGWTIRTWGFCVVVGFAVALWIAMRRGKRVGCDADAMLSIALIGALLGVIGCRGMHLLHNLREQISSGEVGVTDMATMTGGGEILGGIVLATVGVIVYLLVTRNSIRLYLDVVFPPMILAMGIGRIGCLMNGCCWGGVCMTDTGDKALPWAMQFPYGSPPYVRQWEDGELEVPQELLWIPPARRSAEPTEPEPIPRGLLSDPSFHIDDKIDPYLEKVRALAPLMESDPTGPEATELARKVRSLERRISELPGYEYQIAMAAHVHRLSTKPGSPGPVTLDDLRNLGAGQHSRWVHPTQLYDAIGLALLFFVLSAIYYRRRRHGMVIAWTMVLYSISRFLQEMIRVDNPHDVGGLTISQAISIGTLVAGLILMLVLIKFLPLRSPRAPAVRQQPVESPGPETADPGVKGSVSE